MKAKIGKQTAEKEKKKKVAATTHETSVRVAHEPQAESSTIAGPDRYFEGMGRRKTARARVRVYTKGAGITVNGKEWIRYFPSESLQRIVDAPLKKMKAEQMKISVLVSGGGVRAQAEAVRHGIARALVIFNPDFRKRLKRALYLRRDARMKEAKKYGLKKARKAPRWSKR